MMDSELRNQVFQMPFDLQALVDTRVGEPFFSRKNTVFRSTLDGLPVVVKLFAEHTVDSARREYSVLELCLEKGVSAPKPIELRENALVMEFVEGKPLSEVLDKRWLVRADTGADSRPRLEPIAESIGAWFAEFHSAFDNRMRRGDAIARNFLMGQSGVTGIDFEESSESDVMEDIGEICSSVLSMDPAFTGEKIEFCKEVVDSYFAITGVTRMAELDSATAQALRRYAPFRKDGDVMVEKSFEIERNGVWSLKE